VKNILKYCSIFIVISFISCAKDDLSNSSIVGSGIPDSFFVANLEAPSNNKTCETGTSISDTKSEVVFTWTDSIDTDFTADRFIFQLVITNLNTNIAINKTALIANTAKAILDKGIPYSWKIITISVKEGFEVASSETWKFYLAGKGAVNYAPFPAELKTPKSGSTALIDDNGKVTFNWDGSDPDTGDTLRYTLYVDSIDGEQTPPLEQSNLSVKTLKVKLDSASIYYWRIETFDGSDSSYSFVYSFKTE
jgi:hypothetical protein